MKKAVLFLLLLFSLFTFGQQTDNISINWYSKVDFSAADASIKVPQFDFEFFNIDVSQRKIQYRKLISVTAQTDVSTLVISNVTYQSINESELYDLDANLISNKIQASIELVRVREDYKGILILNPIIKVGSEFKKVISFT